MLRSHEWSDEYRTGELEPLEHFYKPAMERSSTYWRASGYFTSGYLNLLGTSLEQFVQREGRMLLVTSLHLSSEDLKAIEDGLSMEEAVEKEVLRLVQNFSAPLPPGVDVLTALLRLGRLEIQIAQRSNGGLYHEKLGVFFEEPCEDPHEAVRGTDFATAAGSDFVTFSGSQNETKAGNVSNYESIDVYTSWEDQRRARKKAAHFWNLWTGQANEIRTFRFPEAAAKVLERKASTPSPPRDETPTEIEPSPGEGRPPQDGPEPAGEDARYSYQEEAVEWFVDPARGRGSGLYWMATGTGKTFTAFKTIKRLFEDGKIDNVVLNTKKRLLDQWYDDMLVGRMPDGTKCAPWMEYDIWHVSGQKDMAEFRQMARYPGKCLFITYGFLPDFLDDCERHNTDLSRTLLVIDEVHNVGAEQMRGKLSLEDGSEEEEDEALYVNDGDLTKYGRFGYRLGLSATPFSDFDDDRNRYLMSIFRSDHIDPRTEHAEWSSFDLNQQREGRLAYAKKHNNAFTIDLAEAIGRGVLVPFEYVPLEFEPSAATQSEMTRVYRLWKKKEADGEAPPGSAEIHRAKVLKAAPAKRDTFQAYLSTLNDEEREKLLRNALLFVEHTEYGREVCSILQTERILYHTFWTGDHPDELRRFSEGDLDTLVTCHMISEGVSINSINNIILFASDRQRLETIQRIGRALRRNSADPAKIAKVIDFVWDNSEADMERHDWLKGLGTVRRTTT